MLQSSPFEPNRQPARRPAMTTHPTPPGAGDKPAAQSHAVAANPGSSRLEKALLPEESVAEFRQLRLGIHEDLRPHGVFEMWLADRFLMNHWRMQRAAIGEAELIAQRRIQATAWENPRRVKTPPTVGAVWGDDQQHYGGALEKLAKQEYRLSLEAGRILRELASRRKARRAENGATADPQISQMDTDELRVAAQEPANLCESVPSVDAVPFREAIEPKPITGNLQIELLPAGAVAGGQLKSPGSNSNPIPRGPNSPTSHSNPIPRGPNSRTSH